MTPPPPIPTAFTAKKAAILESLSAPTSTYTDLSPKGTVDEAIRNLIDRINTIEGVVTTSSCAGRVSVFLEGRKHRSKKSRKRDGDDLENEGLEGEGQAAVPGGKGMGGRWLLVSHEPLGESSGYPSRGFGLEPIKGSPWDVEDKEPHQLRFARFQFEPMILHIMTASLHHAQPILAAAINAGFRESGVQSLKNLDDVNAFPMVAIRSAGLALESVIGARHDRVDDESEHGRDLDDSRGVSIHEEPDEDENEDDEDDGIVCSMVSEEYCEMLRKLANERFQTNSERVKRFGEDLFKRQEVRGPSWEDSEARKERKRADGLRMQDVLRREAGAQHSQVDGDDDVGNGMLFGTCQ